MAEKISNEKLKELLGIKPKKEVKKKNPYLTMTLKDIEELLSNSNNLDEASTNALIEAAEIKMKEELDVSVKEEEAKMVTENLADKNGSGKIITQEKIKKSNDEKNLPQYELGNSKVATDIVSSLVKDKELLDRSLDEWKEVLSKECQVYVYKQQYVVKRYDEIRYKYTSLEEAKQVVKDNLYAILTFNYFCNEKNDDVYAKIDWIVNSLTKNLRTFLIKISFTEEEEGLLMKELPDSCIAFSDGVFDFKTNDYLIKYTRIEIPKLHQSLITYDDYIIDWNFNFPFDDIFKRSGVNIMDLEFEDFIELLKELDSNNPKYKNYCFELCWNMSHDKDHNYSIDRFKHLAQILGYTVIPSFQQFFVFFMGQGSNGKNSLIDGCFSSQISPMPASNSLTDIENDKFIGESLQNSSHNFFLETEAKVYKDSSRLKALTGSPIQTIECKGVGKYQGRLNLKWLFAGNDVSEIKFADTTLGFRRRINILQIYYTWDVNKRFLKFGDRTYYDTTFSANLSQLKTRFNAMTYAYIAMYGVKEATNNFTEDFKFGYNEFTSNFNEIDDDIFLLCTTKLQSNVIFNKKYLTSGKMMNDEERRYIFYEADSKKRIFESVACHRNRIYNYPDFIEWIDKTTTKYEGENEWEEPNCNIICEENLFYVSLQYIKYLYFVCLGKEYKETMKGQFNKMFKKTFPFAKYEQLYNRSLYVKIGVNSNGIYFPED